MFRKNQNWKSAMLAIGVMVAASAGAFAGEEDAVLSLVPSASTITVGDTVEVALIAHAVNPPDVATAGVQVILNWDSDVLALVGFNANVPPDEYVWLQQGFDDDSSLDDLNSGVNTFPFGVPDNDGDAFYSALSQLTAPAQLSPGGLQVTRFIFQAISASPLTDITMPLSFGQFTETAVFSATTPGQNILSEANGTQLTVVPEPATAAILAILSMGYLRMRRNARTR